MCVCVYGGNGVSMGGYKSGAPHNSGWTCQERYRKRAERSQPAPQSSLVIVTCLTSLRTFLFLFSHYVFYTGYFLLISVSFASDLYLTKESLFF